MICQRCTKDVTGNPVHTCNPSPLVRKLEAEAKSLRDALKVIRTWAGHDLDYRSGALDPEHVLKLADKALAAGRVE